VDLIPVDAPDGRPPDNLDVARSGMTDADGRFEVDAILPGRYFIAVNARFGARLDSPYAPTYFPHGDRESATAIEIGEGERKRGFAITVRPLAETGIRGRVVSADEQPVPGADVTIWSTYARGMMIASTKSDSAGTFQVRVPGELTYLLKAAARTPAGARQGDAIVTVTPQMPTIASVFSATMVSLQTIQEAFGGVVHERQREVLATLLRDLQESRSYRGSEVHGRLLFHDAIASQYGRITRVIRSRSAWRHRSSTGPFRRRR